MKAERGIDLGLQLRRRLARQGVHQVEIEIVEQSGRDVDRLACLVAVMDAPQCLQMCIVKTLDADGEAIDAAVTIGRELLHLEGTGVGFQGDFGIGLQAAPGADLRHQSVETLGRQQAWRATAKEDRVDAPAPDQRQG